MRITSVRLHNYKRFTNLVIENIPTTAKLVVMLGPNGCGKSSVFEFMLQQSLELAGIHGLFDVDYHLKESKSREDNASIDGMGFDSHNRSAYDIHMRTAHRNDPNLHPNAIKFSIMEQKPMRVNQNDPQLFRNFQKLIFSDPRNRRKFLSNIEDSMKNLFRDLTLDNLENFTFSKGTSKEFNFQNLSSGEMAALDLLLDLIIKREEYTNTVFCIDEPEAHIGPRMQADLLEALFKLLNDQSQLWIATHAIGMMRKAMELYKRYPGEVVFLDFGDKDFDSLQKLTPAKPNQKFWEKIHRIALEDISELVAPNRIILCESTDGEHGFDAECYNQIFSDEFPDTKFISSGGKKELAHYIPVAKSIAKGAECLRLRDRDNSTPAKISQLQKEGIKVLRKGAIEDYLLSDDILEALCASLRADSGRIPTDGERQLIEIRDNSANIKGAASLIRQAIVRWGVPNIGDDRDDFLRNTVAPCVKPDTQTYKELREIIFGDAQ